MENKDKSGNIDERERVSKRLTEATAGLTGVARQIIDDTQVKIQGPYAEEISKKRKETELTEISELFSELTLSLSSRSPAVVSRAKEIKPELTERETEIINILKNFSAEELTSAVFIKPPSVVAYDADKFNPDKAGGPTVILNPGRFTFYRTTVEDLKYTEKDVEPPAGTNTELFQAGVQAVKRHLNAPTIEDGFKKHSTQRAPWEKGVTNALRAIDDAVDVGKESKDKGKYAIEFSTRFNFNRLAGTRGRYRSVGLQSIQLSLPADSGLLPKIKDLEERYDSLDKKDVFSHSREVTRLARETMELLAS